MSLDADKKLKKVEKNNKMRIERKEARDRTGKRYWRSELIQDQSTSSDASVQEELGWINELGDDASSKDNFTRATSGSTTLSVESRASSLGSSLGDPRDGLLLAAVRASSSPLFLYTLTSSLGGKNMNASAFRWPAVS